MCQCNRSNFGSLCYIAPHNSTRMYYVLGFWANPFGGAVYAVVQRAATGQRNPVAATSRPTLLQCSVCPQCGNATGIPQGYTWPLTANGNVPLYY